MNGIHYPKVESEAEIQATLWWLLKLRGLDCRLEVGAVLNGKRQKLDIVVFRNGIPQAIVECKSWARHYSQERLDRLAHKSKQLRKYRMWGLPVFVCGNRDSIPGIVRLVEAVYYNSPFEPCGPHPTPPKEGEVEGEVEGLLTELQSWLLKNATGLQMGLQPRLQTV
jgi:hypothetical protein